MVELEKLSDLPYGVIFEVPVSLPEKPESGYDFIYQRKSASAKMRWLCFKIYTGDKYAKTSRSSTT